MSDGRDEELYADRSFRPGPPPELREPPPRRSRALGVFVATFALAAFAAVVWYAYDQGLQRGSEATAPLIKADPNPTKVRPEQPGGLQVPNQDKLVYDAMRPNETGAPKVERLLPPPERPVAPPAPPQPRVAPVAPSAEATVPPAPETAPATPPAADTGIPPARIVTPAPTPRIPTPDETPPSPPIEARAQPEPTAVPEVPAVAPPSVAPAPSVANPAVGKRDTAPTPSQVAAASPPPASPPSARPAPGSFRIQVGALREQGAAESEWARLQKRFPGELGALEHRIQKIDLGPGKGVFFRIQSGGVSEASAGAICGGLKAKGQPCIVVKP
ncbi:SPOR domain-containing protein [Thalassobaculum sp.]|uniref:SPOR domain-containing protein n=1 Tax=Thalassobaculum sp. TaxID=2022740 RepID=UPI0032EB42D5